MKFDHIGELVFEIRESLELTVAQMAKKLKVTPTQIYGVESGNLPLSPKFNKKIEKAYRINLHGLWWLMQNDSGILPASTKKHMKAIVKAFEMKLKKGF